MAWLIAYDIRDPKRWRKVYRLVCEHGYRLQYSLFWLPVDRKTLLRLEAALKRVIDPSTDDIRFYPFPDDAFAWLCGPCPWTEGVHHVFAERFGRCWHGTNPALPD